jgi:acyl-coenzyme A synthetase/AMP-(fatty) acid ligase
VSEAAVVGYPHDIKGQGIYAYVSLMNGVKPTDELKTALVKLTICISFYTITCKILTWKSGKICLHKTLMIVINIKGQGIYAYVSLMNGVKPTDELKTALVKLVRSEIGAIATVDPK